LDSSKLLITLDSTLYAGLFGKEAPGMKSIWCSIPLREGNPLGGDLETHRQIPLPDVPNM